MGYVVWTPPQEKGSWISEGDTSIFMNLIDNGLRGGADELRRLGRPQRTRPRPRRGALRRLRLVRGARPDHPPILQGQDKGSPSLTAYQRVVLTVRG